MADPPGVLVELVDVPDHVLPEWRRWYDDVYLRARLAVPGVRAVRRASGFQNPDQQAVKDAEPLELGLVELTSSAVVSSPEWTQSDERLRTGHPERMSELDAAVERRVYEQIISTDDDYTPPADTDLIHCAFYQMAERYHEEFNDWYNTEHIPIQMEVPGYLNTRRFQSPDDPERFVAIYDVEKRENTRGEAARGAMVSAWSDRIRDKLAITRARRLFIVESVKLAD
jgi:hypothetical protein